MNQSYRYLCFNLGEEQFALPLLTVREVIGVPDITSIPQAPNYFLGIMNLRGFIISVMDLRIKINVKPTKSDETAVIILDLNGHNMGVMVDQVNAVVELGANDIAEKPMLDSSKLNEAVTGVFRKDERLVLILDITKILSTDDKQTLAKAA